MLFEHVSFAVAPGGAVLVSGPNGVGKSSLIRIAAGLLRPADGEVTVPPQRALMAEAAALDPARPLGAALHFWATLDPAPASATERVAKALEAVGLAAIAAVPVRLLSTGQRRRAALARVVASGAPLWLLDEPFGALDEITRFALNQTLLSLCQPHDGTPPATAVFVTHSVYEAVFLSQRIVVMARPGRVVDEIAIDEPYPRDAAFRTTPRFTAWCAQVSDALQRASTASVPA